MTIDELVGENLRRAREAVGVSRRDLAQRVTAVGLPLTEADLLGLEAGTTPISVDELVALGLAMGVPPGLLLAPLNLGSLLCVDGDGRATASWSLFHDWARPFSPLSKPGALPATAGEAAPAAPAAPPAPPRASESEPPPAFPTPARADLRAPATDVTPDPPPEPPQESVAREAAGTRSPADPAPRPAPEPSPPWPPEGSPERDWALQALRELHQVR